MAPQVFVPALLHSLQAAPPLLDCSGLPQLLGPSTHQADCSVLGGGTMHTPSLQLESSFPEGPDHFSHLPGEVKH